MTSEALKQSGDWDEGSSSDWDKGSACLAAYNKSLTSSGRFVFSVMRRYRTNVSYSVSESLTDSKNRVN